MDEEFRDELRKLINRYSKESGSNTPDFILCDFVMNTIDAYDNATKTRTNWYGEN